MSGKTSPQSGSTKAPQTLEPDPHHWIKKTGIKSSADVQVPKKLIDQVLGQEAAVAVAKKAAEQKRHLLLIGDPGTGKSMLAKAMAEILPSAKQDDLLVYHNPKNPNNPKILPLGGGLGRPKIQETERKARRAIVAWRIMEYLVSFGVCFFGFYMWFWKEESLLVFLFCLLIALIFLYAAGQKRPKIDFLVPKLLIERSKEAEPAPYVDGTGAHAGALLGDVRHDPFQSGGLETPPHVRVEIGAIHRAHHGVLFIDEINVLRLPSQQALLTALQESKYAIVGQSQSSAGAMVKTDPVPCNFILVAAGNLDAMAPPDMTKDAGMHPALRSRIRGYGYEVYVNATMDDSHDNRLKMIQFVAQEVVRDGKIPHFDASAVAEIIRESQRRSGQTGKLTLRLRELGGLVRTAGDYARDDQGSLVTLKHVRQAKLASRSLEQQITEQEIKRRLNKVSLQDVTGTVIGVANGTAIVGTGEVGEPAGLLVQVEAAFTPALSRHAGNMVLGHRLKRVAETGVENVAAVLKTFKGADIAGHDLHIDATINHPDANAEGIGVAAAVASISALEDIPIRQDFVMIGTLAVKGQIRPVDATLQQVEAGMEAGCKHAIVPTSIKDTLLLDDYIREKIHVHFCHDLSEVMALVADVPEGAKRELVSQFVTKGPSVSLRRNGSTKVEATAETRRRAT